MLFVKKQEPGEAKAPPRADKDYSLFVAKSTSADGTETVSEVLMPEKGSDEGARGLFVRSPKEVAQPTRLNFGPTAVVDVEDVRPVEPPAAPAPEPAPSRAPAAGFGAFRLRPSPAPAPASESAQTAETPAEKASNPVADERASQIEPRLELELHANPEPADASPVKGLFAKRKVDVAEVVAPEASPQPAPSAAKSFFAKRKPDAAEPAQTDESARPAKADRSPIFARKEKTAAVAAPVISAAKPARQSLFGRKGTNPAQGAAVPEASASASAKVRAEKPGATPAKEKRPPKPRAGKNTLQILVSLDNSNNVFFNVTPTGLREVPAEEVVQAASFSADDRRFSIPAKTTYRQAIDLALSEGVGEAVRIVHAPKQFGAVYATSVERIEETAVRIGPGLLLLEKILARGEKPPMAHTVFLLLKDDQSHRSLAILYYRDTDGEISAPQATVNPGNLAFTIAQFQSARGLDADSQVLQITNEELVAAAAELQLYPFEAQWNGISVSKLLNGAVALAAVATIGSVSFAGIQWTQLQATKARIAAAQKEVDKFDGINQKLIAASLISFGKAQSLDVGRLSARAAALWVPRATLTVDASASREAYVVSMPLTAGGYVNNKPSALSALNNSEIQQLLKLTPPEECTKNMPGVSGGVNVIQLSVNCETPSGSIGRYRLD